MMTKKSSLSVEGAAFNKRIVLCTGDKGGTGKSTVARFLLDMYLANNILVTAYDCDSSNPQLWRHYNYNVTGGVKTLKFNQRAVNEVFLNDLSTLAPVVSLVDLPPGVGEYFKDFVQDIESARLGYRITMVWVLGRVKDSIIRLKQLIESCGNQVDYVVVKNLYWGEDGFTRYDKSKTRAAVNELGAIELNFFPLIDPVYDKIDELDLSFREGLLHQKLTSSNKARLRVWIQENESEFVKAAIFLSLVGV
ncbi:hypothetical protein ACWATR_39650 [Nostoc sp. UIC 10890]